MPAKLTIAIDYDGTYTADPLMWMGVIIMMKRMGHTVICATMRTGKEAQQMDPNLINLVDAVVPTFRKAKKAAVLAAGHAPDIWIDDNPEWLYKDAAPVNPAVAVGLGG